MHVDVKLLMIILNILKSENKEFNNENMCVAIVDQSVSNLVKNQSCFRNPPVKGTPTFMSTQVLCNINIKSILRNKTL